MKKNTFYISTPLYYANDELHIGHAFTTLAADIASRFNRSMGRKVHFLTGSDEHGQKVQQAARAKNIEPLAHTDALVEKFKSLWIKLNIRYEDFIRTTEPRHKSVVVDVLTRLKETGDIYLDEYSGRYCTPCERFWTEKEVEKAVCPDCKRPVEEIREKNYFFRMSAYQEKLIRHIKDNPDFIRPENRRNEVLGFLAKPLGDLCISRPKSRLSWGIELPFDSDFVTYVWFDALTNYISAAGYLKDNEKFEALWPADFHLVGKDILTTHAVYWTTMLMALGLDLPKAIFAHGWWVQSGGKMSKSIGNVIKPLDLVEKYGLDPFRFYLFREMVFGSDAVFSEESFVLRYNADLANDYGNLLQRTLPMLVKHRNGVFCKRKPELKETIEVSTLAAQVKASYLVAMEGLLFHDALKSAWELISRLNKYIDEAAPWALAKNGNFGLLDEVFYTVGEGIRFVSHLVSPFMPASAERFMEQVGLREGFVPLPNLEWGQLPDQTRCGDPCPVFPRIDTPRIESLKKGAKAPAERPAEKTENDDDMISYDDFLKTQLCVAEVIEAEKVEKADKLLKLTVKLGEETRSLVAGIAEYYTPEQLIGRQVVMVKNLKPAKIRGIVSHGMILAAPTPDGRLALVSPGVAALSGSRVK